MRARTLVASLSRAVATAALAATVAPPVLGALPAAASSSGVVISEFQTTGSAGGNDEFVELLNAGGSSLDVSGWKLQGCASSSGAASNRATVPAGVVLAAGQHILFTNHNGYSGGVAGDVTYGSAIADTGGIRVVDGEGVVVDGVGTTTPAINECREGTGVAMGASGGLYAHERLAAGTQDTDNNAADLSAAKAANPQNYGGPFPAVAPIHSVQGAGQQSPVEGTTVTVEGVVTGIDDEIGAGSHDTYTEDAGIFVQEEAADADANPATSEGIFAGNVGNRAAYPAGTVVRVTGTVEEKFGQTILSVADGASPTVVGSAAVPSPAEIDQAQAEGQDSSTRAYYESLEGMRVRLASGVANSGGTTVNGDLFLTPGTAAGRIFRNDTVPALMGAEDDAGAGNPSNPYTNPIVSSTRVQADAFDRIDDLVGPLVYSYGHYKVMVQAGRLPTVTGGGTPYPFGLAPAGDDHIRVATLNMHNFFGVNAYNDLHYVTASEFAAKRDRIAAAINNQLLRPDVIAAQEVESIDVLGGLAATLGGYTAFLTEGNDDRGIDVGLLVKNTVGVANVRQLGKTATGPSGVECSDVPGGLFDRPPLAADVTTRDGLAFTVIANHFASQGRSEACRDAQAAYVRDAVTVLEATGGEVVVLGDLNDFEDSTALGVLQDGLTSLTNQWSSAPAGERYSYAYSGKLQTLDHILITDGLDSRRTDFRYAHFDVDYYDRGGADGHKISDHDPAVLTLLGDTNPPPAPRTSTVGSLKGNAEVAADTGYKMAEVRFDVNRLGALNLYLGLLSFKDTTTGQFGIGIVLLGPPLARTGLNGAQGKGFGITSTLQFVNVAFSVDDRSTVAQGPDKVAVSATGGAYNWSISGATISGDLTVI